MKTPEQKAARQAARRKMVANWPPYLRWVAYLLEFVLYIFVASIVIGVCLAPIAFVVWLTGKAVGVW